MAHPAERDSYLAKIELMKKYSNLYLDLSGTGIFRWGMLTHGVNEIGAERFIYGSDFPVCNPAMYYAGVKAEGLCEKDEELIFSGNFRRLAHL